MTGKTLIKLPAAPVAQLDRAFDYESKGREFESSRARHISYILLPPSHFFLQDSVSIINDSMSENRQMAQDSSHKAKKPLGKTAAE